MTNASQGHTWNDFRRVAIKIIKESNISIFKLNNAMQGNAMARKATYYMPLSIWIRKCVFVFVRFHKTWNTRSRNWYVLENHKNLGFIKTDKEILTKLVIYFHKIQSIGYFNCCKFDNNNYYGHSHVKQNVKNVSIFPTFWTCLQQNAIQS